MTEPCSDLVPFLDGELDPEPAEAFRAHLRTCTKCQIELMDAMQLNARLHALSPTERHDTGAPPSPPELPPNVEVEPTPAEEGAASVLAGGSVLPGAPVPSIDARRYQATVPAAAWRDASMLRVIGLARRRATRNWRPWAAAVASAAAVVVLVFAVLPGVGPRPVVSVAPTPDPFDALHSRPFDVRLAYGPAANWRPVKARMRGAPDVSQERVPHAAIAALEKRGDRHGVAISQAWNGVSLSNVVADLRAIEQTPAVRNDLAALLSIETSEDNLEPILTELEALAKSDDVAVARAAAWNYAVLLEQLELRLSAQQAFEAIARAGEPGWSDDARRRARDAAAATARFEAPWLRAEVEGKALVRTGAAVSRDSLRAAPGMMRAYLYNAVRAAPTRARVLALAPIAAELDQLDDRPVLSDYVRRVAKLDFRQRAPLAAAFASLLEHMPPTDSEIAALTTPTPSGDVADIVMGAMIERHVATDHLAAFRALVKAADDPWFEIVLAKEAATADEQRGDWLVAEGRLRKAAQLCTPAITYQCLDLARRQGLIYQQLHRIPAARAVVRAAARTAQSVGEWGRYRQMIYRMADTERFNSSTALTRAYAHEFKLLLRSDKDCTVQVLISSAALLDLDGAGARHALDQALTCVRPDLAAATTLSEVGRLDPRADDLTTLQDWLGTLRASNTLTAAQGVFSGAIEGRLQIERDREPGAKLLENTIQQAEALRGDVNADMARAGAYSALVFDAVRHRDPARALELVARELGLPTPIRCAVAMNAEDERAAVIVRGADGQDHARYDVVRQRRTRPLKVPDDLAQALTSCAHVQVMARAAVQGQPGVLPAAFAWSYAIGAHRAAARPTPAPGRPRILTVVNVTPPAELKLATLAAEPVDPAPEVRALAGREATPSRVLAEMTDATEIQFHTHALVDADVSDAAHLVLSPESDGRYALTAEAIRGSKLRGSPVVVLAACHSAQGAVYQHAAWSLPEAFVAAGARAVFATGTDIPDLEAGPFFARVLGRVRTGADPATALRDERIRVLRHDPKSWVADVVVFE